MSRLIAKFAILNAAFLWMFALGARASSEDFTGKVVDPQDAPIAGAEVVLYSSQGTALHYTATDAQGIFEVPKPVSGASVLKLDAPHFRTVHYPINNRAKADGPVIIKMGIASANTEITVTASRGSVQYATSANQLVTVRDNEYLARLPLPTIGNALENSPGILVQQTTYGQSSPYLRGLTGYQTLLLLDGLRFNTSIFRSGPNQYISYINPSQVERLEAVLGPTSATYGSDSLGGTINMLTVSPLFVASGDKSSMHGEFNAMGASADASGSASARLSGGTPNVLWMIGGTARRMNNLRTGEGIDSRNAFHRYMGLSLEEVKGLLGARMKDSGFSQYGADAKLVLHPGESHTLTLNYLYSGIHGERSYRDMLGGQGKLQSLYDPQDLNFGYLRYEKQRLGFLDSLTAAFSVNSQGDGAIKQNQKLTDAITTDDNRITAYGYTLQGTMHAGRRNTIVFGGDSYDERIASTRFVLDPVKGFTVQQRAQYPNDTRYMISGFFAQNASDLIRNKLKITGGIRVTDVRMWTYANSNKNAEGQSLGVSDTSQTFSDVTFNTGISWQINSFAGVNFSAGRGFRAPNVTDMSSLGYISQGAFDVPSAAAEAVGAFMGADSGDGALSTGKRIRELESESLYSYEFGLTITTQKFYARTQLFDSELMNPIVGRTILFPAGQAPASIAGVDVTPITPTAAQLQQGVVAVQTPFSTRAVRTTANDGHSKYYGIESLMRFKLNATWNFDWNYTYMVGRDLNPNRVRSRLPPQQGSAAVRFSPSGKYWLELRGRFAGSQYNMSGGDFDDDRLGASRRRSDISTFFKGGFVRPYLDPGSDRQFGTADDLFAPTGETLRQIQDRVLPLGATMNGVIITGDSTRVPLYLGTDGWWTLDLTGAWTLNDHARLNFGLTNMRDKNYRSHGSGLDAAGVNAFVGVNYSF